MRTIGNLHKRGFTLIEILVALAVFAALAAIAYGALSQIARTRAALSTQQDRFTAVARAIGDLERDLRQIVARPVRGNYGEQIPALLGASDHIELTRLGYANPRAELRSQLERAIYALDGKTLRRGRFGVLDRAPNSVPDTRALLDGVSEFRVRYLAPGGGWQDSWPPRDVAPESLPRAVEFRLALDDYGELRRVIGLPSPDPAIVAGAAVPGGAIK